MNWRQIKPARVKRGLRQTDLAELLQIDQSTLHRWETGGVPVNEEYYRRVLYAIEKLKEFLAESRA
jgi:ribosome-binding protein aMBF1 (putative translation factor)